MVWVVTSKAEAIPSSYWSHEASVQLLDEELNKLQVGPVTIIIVIILILIIVVITISPYHQHPRPHPHHPHPHRRHHHITISPYHHITISPYHQHPRPHPRPHPYKKGQQGLEQAIHASSLPPTYLA